ncbi:hypothetical protein [Caldinitratiruptor microaerophilus]|uniref:Uncharacterized protein n=1 Tax=Caldinitratiruptor microaerophilus TaxID=671077 RepID=A0AA35CKJ2_9FIRM|nr:hypothetical protein [Caldinitratiruptor microaerophilus]BDG60990.1 hypothetical protein caldi_20800 [Caldinitratiruptor microaerophilus]
MRLLRRTVTGLLTGLLTGVVAGALAALAGAPPATAALAAFTLGIPLALLGAGYDLLLELGRVRPGGLAEVVAYWALAFPVARTLQQVVLAWGSGQPAFGRQGAGAFLTFQAAVGGVYGIGFLLLHVQVHALLRPWLREEG